jgi:HEAT repeat protein/MFS family permease
MDTVASDRLTTPDGRRISQRALQRGLRVNIVAGALGTMWVATLGIATTMFMECLGASGVLIGMVVTIQQLAMAVQIPAAYFAERLVSRKAYWASVVIVQRMLWFIPALLPFLLSARPGRTAWAMLGVVALSSILTYMATATWFSWMADLVPERSRGRFWGVRQSYTMATYLLSMAATGWILDRFPDPRTEGGTFAGFAIVFAAAAFLGTADIIVHLWVPEPKPGPGLREANLLRRIAEPLRDRDFLWTTLAFGAWTFSLGLVGSFYLIYLTREFQATYSHLAALSISASLATILFSPVWGRVMDSIGARAFGALALTVLPVFPLAWFFVKAVRIDLPLPFGGMLSVPQPVLLLFCVNLVAGAFYSGVSLCQYNLSSALVPREGRTMALAVHWTIVGLLGAGGPVVGGALMDHFTAHPVGVRLPTGTPMGFHQVLVLVHIATLWLVVLPLLMRVRKRTGDVSVRLLVGNPLRTVGIIQNIVQIGAATSSQARAEALRKIGQRKSAAAVPELIRQLDDPSAEVREAAALALGRAARPEAVDALIEKLEDPESDFGPEIARALREAKHPRSVEPLVRQLASADRETQVESARTLGKLGDRRAGPSLLNLLHRTRDAKVASASSEALAQLGEIAAIHEILPRMKQTRNPVLGRSLAVALGDLLGREEDFYTLLVTEQEAPGAEVTVRLQGLRRTVRRKSRRGQGQELLKSVEALEEAYEEERYADAAALLGKVTGGLSRLAGRESRPAAGDAVSLHGQRFDIGSWYVDLLQHHWNPSELGPLDRTAILLGIHFACCMGRAVGHIPGGFTRRYGV